MDGIVPLADSLLNSDRRLHPRQDLQESYLELEDDIDGIILNISQQGLAMESVRNLASDGLLRIRFRISRSGPWIEATGRVAWTNGSQTIVGLQFINLASIGTLTSETVNAERTIKNPIQVPITDLSVEVLPAPLSKKFTAKDFGSTDIENVLPVMSSGLTLFPQAELRTIRNEELPHRSLGTGWRFGLPLAAVLLLSALGFVLGFHFPKISKPQQPPRVQGLPIAGQDLAEVARNSSAKPEAPTVETRTALNPSGLTLQVGAMRYSENADALAKSLHQKGFPAFIIRASSDQLFRVLVGSYRDASAARKVEEDLKNQGFPAILRKQSVLPL